MPLQVVSRIRSASELAKVARMLKNILAAVIAVSVHRAFPRLLAGRVSRD